MDYSSQDTTENRASVRLVLAVLLLFGLLSRPARALWIGTARPAGLTDFSSEVPITVAPQRNGRLLTASATPTPTPLGWQPTLPELSALLDAAWNAQEWPEVLHLIDLIITMDPNYEGIQEKYYYAYVNYGYELMTEGCCSEALDAFRQALVLRPDGEEALRGLDLLGRYCQTPTPSPGQPTPTPTPYSPPQSTPFLYTVQAGDTLYSLAQRYGTSVQEIMAANGMMSYLIRVGEEILIPVAGTTPSGPMIHIVQPGETLIGIARHYNTTVWAIMSANGLTTRTIWAYRALFIPTASQSASILHIVMPGETLYTIAQRHGTTVALLMMANHLTDYRIRVYQTLAIPPEGWDGWPELLTPGSRQSHVVQAGDTLFSIARQYGTTVAALMSANGLTSSLIHAGDMLRIP